MDFSAVDENEAELIDNCAKVMSAADEPVILSKTYDKDKLSEFSLMTRKGERCSLMAQNTEDMSKFCDQLLELVDRRVNPKNDDDHIGGKYYQSDAFSNVYYFKNLDFQLDPNRSWTYLETLKEENTFMSQCLHKFRAVCSALDTSCINKNNCFYKNVFFPKVKKPGPVILPETLVDLIVIRKHDLNPVGLIDWFECIYEYLEFLIVEQEGSGNKNKQEKDNDTDFEKVKWHRNICICCLFMQQSHIQLQAKTGHWVIKGLGDSQDAPIEAIQLIGYDHVFNDDVSQSTDCFSNVIDINGTKMTSLIKFPFEYFEIVLEQGTNDKFVVLKKER